MELKAEIQQAVKTAMKSRDSMTVSTLRLLLSAVHNEEIKVHRELSTEEIQKTISILCKQRNEAIELFRKGGREELAQKEDVELKILQHYLPQPLTEEAVRGLIQDSINELGAKGMQDLGRAMKIVMATDARRTSGKPADGE